jgi:hypothetical protein
MEHRLFSRPRLTRTTYAALCDKVPEDLDRFEAPMRAVGSIIGGWDEFGWVENTDEMHLLGERGEHRAKGWGWGS